LCLVHEKHNLTYHMFCSVDRHYCYLSVERWTVSEWRNYKTGRVCSTHVADVKCVQNVSMKTSGGDTTWNISA
jgi:hypothetical protein